MPGPSSQVSSAKKRAFDTNCYNIMKRDLKSSPKMVAMIHEVYDSARIHKDVVKKRKQPPAPIANSLTSPIALQQ